jgi:ATP-binding cassette subfamily C (CFTR/MRP) protein 1
VEELMIPEEHQQGEIKLKVFKQYIDYNGGMCSFALVVILAMLFWILSTTFASIFMSFWCSNPQQFPDGLYIYAALSLSSSVFILIRASVLILAGVKQGEKVHRLMINALLKASLIKFYNRVPIGRIVNRLTKDLRELDEAIGPAIGGLLVCAFQMLGTIAICIYSSSPYLLIPTACIAVFCWKVKNYYLNIQREVTRL